MSTETEKALLMDIERLKRERDELAAHVDSLHECIIDDPMGCGVEITKMQHIKHRGTSASLAHVRAEAIEWARDQIVHGDQMAVIDVDVFNEIISEIRRNAKKSGANHER